MHKPKSPFVTAWSEHRGLGVLGDTKSRFTVDTGKNIATMHVPFQKEHNHDTASAFAREASAAKVKYQRASQRARPSLTPIFFSLCS